MVKLFMLITSLGAKVKLYIGLVIAFAGIIGMAVLKGQSMQKTKDERDNLKRRLRGINHKQEVQKDVKSSSDDDLIDGITRRK